MNNDQYSVISNKRSFAIVPKFKGKLFSRYKMDISGGLGKSAGKVMFNIFKISLFSKPSMDDPFSFILLNVTDLACWFDGS